MYVSGWWFFATPLKNHAVSSSVGMMKFPTRSYGRGPFTSVPGCPTFSASPGPKSARAKAWVRFKKMICLCQLSVTVCFYLAVCQNLVTLVNIKIAGIYGCSFP